MKRILIGLSLLLCAAIAAAPAVGKHRAHGKGPEVIPIPNGFQPEGITTFGRDKFLVSSRATGAIYKGSLRTGKGRILVQGGTGRAATGIKVDRRGRLFVSGAGSKAIRIYDVRGGEEIESYPLPDSQFINDVVLTRRGAYFTDSRRPVLYFVPRDLGALQTIQIGGEWTQQDGVNNANGIVATRRSLVLVKSNTGEAFALPQVTQGTAEARRIAITGGELDNSDGLLLKGRTLYAVENRDPAPEGIGVVSAVKLSRDLTRGRIVKEITSEHFEVPSTIAASKRGLYVVNAKFNIATPTPDTPYEVVRVPKR
jgi:sugar lactone lactonase YvrE